MNPLTNILLVIEALLIIYLWHYLRRDMADQVRIYRRDMQLHGMAKKPFPQWDRENVYYTIVLIVVVGLLSVLSFLLWS